MASRGREGGGGRGGRAWSTSAGTEPSILPNRVPVVRHVLSRPAPPFEVVVVRSEGGADLDPARTALDALTDVIAQAACEGRCRKQSATARSARPAQQGRLRSTGGSHRPCRRPWPGTCAGGGSPWVTRAVRVTGTDRGPEQQRVVWSEADVPQVGRVGRAWETGGKPGLDVGFPRCGECWLARDAGTAQGGAVAIDRSAPRRDGGFP